MAISISLLPSLALIAGPTANNPPPRPKTRLYYHWGDVEGNSTLLKLGGLDRPAHFADLNPGGDATLNDAVMAQVDTWYKIRREDAGGSGVYMSPRPLSSREFGNDLVMVEVEEEEGAAPIPFNPNIKERADRALANGKRDSLPLMSSYFSEEDWIVISRPPQPKDKIRIRFRPPTAQDVETIWKQIQEEPAAAQFETLAEMANEISGHGSGAPLTRAADIVFQRVLFDHAVEKIIESPAAAAKAFPRIARAFLAKLPHDGRTARVFQSYYQHWKKDREGNPLTEAMLRESHLLSPEQQLEMLGWVVGRQSNGGPGAGSAPSGTNLFSVLGLIDRNYDRLDEGQKDRVGVVLGQLEKEIQGWPEPSEVSHYWEFANRALGPQAAAERLQSLARSLNDQMYQRAAQFDERGSFAYEEGARLTKLIPALPPALRDVFLEALASPPKGKSGALKTLSGKIAILLSPLTQNAKFKAFARKTIRDELRHKRDPFEGILDHYLGDLHSPDWSRNFVRSIESLIDSLPEFGNELVTELEANQEMLAAGDDIPWSRLIKKAKAAAGNDITEKLESARRRVWTHAKNIGTKPPDQRTFDRAYQHSVETIEGSHDYSVMARTFVLVDPLFVSEDLRLKHATRPFERFNESKDGGHDTQPAWENFNQSWESLAETLWIWPTVEQMRRYQGYYVSKLLDHVEELLSGRVDGGGQERFENWDRSKYVTKIPHQDWQAWGLDEQSDDLKKFFKIKKTAAGYELQFLDYPALLKNIPNLARDTHKRGRDSEPHVIARYIENSAMSLKDPIARATRILYLTTRLHPALNGNGRSARTYAAAELVRAGYPIPIGFPTTDFMMSEKHLELEVRKAILLGGFWQKMLIDAKNRGVPPDRFFQDVFKGSPLEGFLQVDSKQTAELERYVHWLEAQKELPQWGADLARAVEEGLRKLNASGKTLAQLDELQRANLVQDAWSEAYATVKLNLHENLPFDGPAPSAKGRFRRRRLSAPIRCVDDIPLMAP